MPIRIRSIVSALVVLAAALPACAAAQRMADSATMGAPRAACERPAAVTAYHSRETLRRELERFRVEEERARGALPPRGTAAYEAGMARYRVAIAAYREAAAHTRRRCRWVPNQVLALIPSPVQHTADGDVIMLDVLYYYTGDHGSETSIGAITRLNGESTGYWAYRPVRLERGLRCARVRLAMNRESPGTYRSDAVEVEMYVHRASTFTERGFPLEHTWRRER